MAARWSLSGVEALTLLGEPLSDGTERQDRLQSLLGVHRSLLLIAPDPERCRRVLREGTPFLDGSSMLQIMLSYGLPGTARVRAISWRSSVANRPRGHNSREN